MAKVLIVDDDRTMVSLLSTLLELDGHEVFQATGEESFWKSMDRDQPDVVLMDVYLANTDGLELLKEARANEKSRRVPFILSSGMELSDECLAAGANDFLLKPYNPDQLVAAINKQLGIIIKKDDNEASEQGEF